MSFHYFYKGLEGPQTEQPKETLNSSTRVPFPPFLLKAMLMAVATLE